MKEFPLPLFRARSGRIVLDEAQRDWLRETFPVTENNIVCRMMGISWPTLYRLAHDLGISKTVEGMKAIRKRQGEWHSRKVRQEKLRLLGGGRPMECTNVRLQPFTKGQVGRRHRAVSRYGYIITEGHVMHDCHPDRWVIFYDDGTRRSQRFEENSRGGGFVFMPLEGAATDLTPYVGENG